MSDPAQANHPHATATDVSALQDLNALVVSCPELRKLEELLGNFNLFRVLRFERGEIRHSNVLAWLLRPDEAHGLNDLFLRRWLMRVFHESPSEAASYLDPVHIDSMTIRSVEVFREWNNIDLLVKVRTFDDGDIIIAIENKVDAEQSFGQLTRYRERVEKQHANAAHRLYVFLTQREQEPEDAAWAVGTYHQLHDVLAECMEEQRSSIGQEPRVLLDHYLLLLRESFMEENEIAELARKIYDKHSRALDIIFEHRRDSRLALTEALREHLVASGAQLKLKPMLITKGLVRFLPTAWDTPSNLAGKAWGQTGSAYILCEVYLFSKKPVLKMVEGKAPGPWRDQLWALSRNKPFTQTQKRDKQPAQWMSVYSVRGSHDLEDLESQDIGELAFNIWQWCQEQIVKPEFQQAVEAVRNHLAALPQP